MKTKLAVTAALLMVAGSAFAKKESAWGEKFGCYNETNQLIGWAHKATLCDAPNKWIENNKVASDTKFEKGTDADHTSNDRGLN